MTRPAQAASRAGRTGGPGVTPAEMPADRTALRPVVEAKKAPVPPARRTGVLAVAGIAVLPLVTLSVLVATTAVLVTLLLWLL